MAQILKEWRPRQATLETIEQANTILDEYDRQGYTMTLRQLHYQFIARDYGLNTQPACDRLDAIMNDARLAGMTSMEMLVGPASGIQCYGQPWPADTYYMHCDSPDNMKVKTIGSGYIEEYMSHRTWQERSSTSTSGTATSPRSAPAFA